MVSVNKNSALNCNARFIWILVIVIVLTNAMLLIKYHSMLDDSTSGDSQRSRLLSSPSSSSSSSGLRFSSKNRVHHHYATRRSQHHRHDQHLNNKPPRLSFLGGGAAGGNETNLNSTNSSDNQQHQEDDEDELSVLPVYGGAVVDGRFSIPEIASTSKNAFGRLLAAHNLFIAPGDIAGNLPLSVLIRDDQKDAEGDENDASGDEQKRKHNKNNHNHKKNKKNSKLHHHKPEAISDSAATASSKKDSKNNKLIERFLLRIYNEDDFDAADLLLSRMLPVRFWRLDPLVPEAAVLTTREVHRRDNRFTAQLHKVKHAASVMRFRWPWHMTHWNEKMTRMWVDSWSEREKVVRSVVSALPSLSSSSPSSSSSSSSSLSPQQKEQEKQRQSEQEQQKLDHLLRQHLSSGDLSFSDEVAAEIESVIESDSSSPTSIKLPLYLRRILSSRLRARKIFQATGCNVFRVPFTSASEDERCTAYLGDVKRNWKRLKPLPARYDARTIKFQVEFNEPGLHSVLKVPQRLFPYEAFAEIGAYHADRVLGVRRIPATAYVCIPKDMIRETVKRDGHTIETDEETLKESGVKNYEEWVEKDLLKFSDKSQYNLDDRGDCVGASIQPLLADVHHLLDGALAVPYKTHDKGWHDYYNFTPSSSENNKNTNNNINNNVVVVGPYGEATNKQDLPLRFISSPYSPTVLHMAELVAFDYIVGNNDRSPNKNFFVVGSCIDDFSICSEDETAFFAVQRNRDVDFPGLDLVAADAAGGEKSIEDQNSGKSPNNNNNNNNNNSNKTLQKKQWELDKSALRRTGAPTFIHIDQGMAFYRTPTDNALTKSLEKKSNTAFCVFRRRFINRLLDLFGAEQEVQSNGDKEEFVHMLKRVAIGDNSDVSGDVETFSKMMQQRLPARAMHAAVLTREHFAACERRMRRVLLQLSRCLSVYSIDDVITP